jgi:hypothetical protein
MTMTQSATDADRQAPVLCDEQGPIPAFPPRALDAQGRLIPLSPEERQARSAAVLRALRAITLIPDDDPPELSAEGMRDIDAHRPHRPLFEGLY